MQTTDVLIIGGGIAGLTTADELAGLGFSSLIVQHEHFLGGHAVQLACKATDECQKCGVCLVEDRLKRVIENKDIQVTVQSALTELIMKDGRFLASILKRPTFIDPQKCSNCGLCLKYCPQAARGAIIQSHTPYSSPAFGFDSLHCARFTAGVNCTICSEQCPQGAISFDVPERQLEVSSDALVVAVGFTPFDPAPAEQFGYGVLPDVISGFDLEQILRREGKIFRPSDGRAPDKMAFIQCVGSREKKHPFCSEVCCAYALRTARAIKARQPSVSSTVFYIDIQNFGKDFLQNYQKIEKSIRLVRMIPGDIIRTRNNRLRVCYMDEATHNQVEEEFDLIVLSTGFRPSEGNRKLAGLLGIELTASGFFPPDAHIAGLFAAGTALGPMNIANTIADAVKTAWETAKYLTRTSRHPKRNALAVCIEK